jgi:hypothetical protein
MADDDDQDLFTGIVDFVNDSVVLLPNAPAFPAAQFLASGRPRVAFQFDYRIENAFPFIFRDVIKRFPGTLFDRDFVALDFLGLE